MSLYTLAPQPWLIFLDDSGVYLPNGQLAIYAAGTMTPAIAYTSATGTAHPFPITLDSAGRVPGGLYLQPGLNYKFVLHEPQIEEPLDGGIIKTQEPVEAVPHSGGSTLTLVTPGDHAALNVAGVDLIEYVGSGDVFIRGMVGGVPGQGIYIRNRTAFTIWLYSEDPSAPAGAALLNFVAMGPTPVVGPRGVAHYIYLSTGIWAIDTHAQGDRLVQPYNAANYGSSNAGGGWVVGPDDIVAETFFLENRTLFYAFSYQGTGVSGSPFTLTRAVPVGWQLVSLTSTNIVVFNGTNWEAGTALYTGPVLIGFNRMPPSAWPTVTNGISVDGQIVLPLN